MTESGLIKLPEWQALAKHRDVLIMQRLSALVLGDPKRLENSILSVGGLKLNYALNYVTPETLGLLSKLAAARSVEAWRASMLRGDKINSTENRAALHVALRQSSDTPVVVDGQNIIPAIRSMQQRMTDFATALRDGRCTGVTGKRIRQVVNIGIGGSDLGPRMAVLALAPYCNGPETHFVANADAFELSRLFKKLDPAETVFVVVSKTFGTQETLLNAKTARAWVAEQLGEVAIAKHFVAVTTNHKAAVDFGILSEHIFPMWDWVGGRFSLWSAVGMAIMLSIGQENFSQLLRGAEAMDQHFIQAPLEKNMPVLLAMLGVWARNFLGRAAHAVLPYSERLREFPRYLQQLEMESNGKSVGRDGKAVDVVTVPILFGEPGTVGQHGFHQWLHQGSNIISADFIGVTKDDLGYADHHQALLSNMVAQAGALAFGQTEAAEPHNIYPGNRSSSILMLDELTPFNLGALLALYEHKVFVQSIVWGINPFDQPGVELGKRMARDLSLGLSVDPRNNFLSALYKMVGQ